MSFTDKQKMEWFDACLSRLESLPGLQTVSYPDLVFDALCVRHGKTPEPGDDNFSGWALYLDLSEPAKPLGTVVLGVSTPNGWEETLPPRPHLSELLFRVKYFLRQIFLKIGYKVEVVYENYGDAND